MNNFTTVVDSTAGLALTETTQLAGSNFGIIAITILAFTLFIYIISLIYNSFYKYKYNRKKIRRISKRKGITTKRTGSNVEKKFLKMRKNSKQESSYYGKHYNELKHLSTYKK